MSVLPAPVRPSAIAGHDDWPDFVARTPPHAPAAGPRARIAAALGVAAPVLPAVTEGAGAVRDGVRTTELSWQTGFGPRTRAWLLEPARRTGSGALPGVLGLHCHGGVKSVGAEQLVDLGPASSGAALDLRHGCYGGRAPAAELARRGAVVLCHDAFAWGSRGFDLADPVPRVADAVAAAEARWRQEGVEPTAAQRYDAAAGAHENVVATCADLLGTTFAGTVLHDDLVALEVLAQLPGVDPGRLGAFGFSGGGVRAALLAALDERLRAVVVTCMMTTYAALVPGHVDRHSRLLSEQALRRTCEWPDVLRAAEGTAVLVQYGRHDELFPAEGMLAADERLRTTIGQRYTGSWFDGPHRFGPAEQDEAFGFLLRQAGAAA
ncbi:acetylesterase [Kineococcus glutinatus]|uniref:Acetyl xylan esterase AXE1 n=1 Tax=Kineococcus glutinatus TaxID=1070872 RepID=A0ABP9I185_9ACTN